MHGNLWEWCEDDWHISYERAPEDGSAWKTGGSLVQVLRGGSWLSPARFCRSAGRGRDEPSHRLDGLGFRPAADLPEVR